MGTVAGVLEHIGKAAVNFRALAEILLTKNGTAPAKAYAEQALDVLEKKLGETHPEIRKTYQVLAGIYEKNGDT